MRDLTWKFYHRWWQPKLHHVILEVEAMGGDHVEITHGAVGRRLRSGQRGRGVGMEVVMVVALVALVSVDVGITGGSLRVSARKAVRGGRMMPNVDSKTHGKNGDGVVVTEGGGGGGGGAAAPRIGGARGGPGVGDEGGRSVPRGAGAQRRDHFQPTAGPTRCHLGRAARTGGGRGGGDSTQATSKTRSWCGSGYAYSTDEASASIESEMILNYVESPLKKTPAFWEAPRPTLDRLVRRRDRGLLPSGYGTGRWTPGYTAASAVGPRRHRDATGITPGNPNPSSRNNANGGVSARDNVKASSWQSQARVGGGGGGGGGGGVSGISALGGEGPVLYEGDLGGRSVSSQDVSRPPRPSKRPLRRVHSGPDGGYADGGSGGSAVAARRGRAAVQNKVWRGMGGRPGGKRGIIAV
eukprot:jgi/Undpi1/1045/HiC_scaffold_10.g04508.m1